MSQNVAMARRESQKFKTVLSSIGTVILKVCEGPESATESGMDWRGNVSVWACVYVHVCVRVCTLVHTSVCIYDRL